MSTSDILDPSRVRRIIVTKLRRHGDVPLAIAILGPLRQHLAQAEIEAPELMEQPR